MCMTISHSVAQTVTRALHSSHASPSTSPLATGRTRTAAARVRRYVLRLLFALALALYFSSYLPNQYTFLNSDPELLQPDSDRVACAPGDPVARKQQHRAARTDRMRRRILVEWPALCRLLQLHCGQFNHRQMERY